MMRREPGRANRGTGVWRDALGIGAAERGVGAWNELVLGPGRQGGRSAPERCTELGVTPTSYGTWDGAAGRCEVPRGG
jgi:hypothetical protein